MKNLFLIVLLTFVGSKLNLAQNQIIEKFYTQYQSAHNTTKAEKNIQKLIDKLEKKTPQKSTISEYRVIHQRGDRIVPTQVVNQLIDDLEGDSFEELVKVNDESSRAYLLIKENENEMISDLFFLKQEHNEFLFFTLSGNINFSEIINSGFHMSID